MLNGTLWEGRFCSCLAQFEEYVLACYRYTELNPVRINVVSYYADLKGRKGRRAAIVQRRSELPLLAYLRDSVIRDVGSLAHRSTEN